jgi:hypothetical protein
MVRPKAAAGEKRRGGAPATRVSAGGAAVERWGDGELELAGVRVEVVAVF